MTQNHAPCWSLITVVFEEEEKKDQLLHSNKKSGSTLFFQILELAGDPIQTILCWFILLLGRTISPRVQFRASTELERLHRGNNPSQDVMTTASTKRFRGHDVGSFDYPPVKHSRVCSECFYECRYCEEVLLNPRVTS